MRRLSETARDLLDRVERGLSGFSSQQMERARQVERLGDTREPAVLPHLAAILPQAWGSVADATREAIEKIVAAADVLDIVDADRDIREFSAWGPREVRPSDVATLSRRMTSVLGVLSCSPYGYVRQRAVELLCEVGDGQELPFLLIRLNDWVREVREVARSAIARRLKPEHAAHFARCLPLLDRLRRQRRADHSQLLEEVLQLLRSDTCREALHGAIRSPSRHVRRLAFQLLANNPGQDLHPVLQDALAARDPILRLWAVQASRKHLAGQLLLQVLQNALADPSIPVRRDALIGLAEHFPESATEQLLAALTDTNKSIREVARFYLRQAGTTGFAGRYRRWLSAGEGNLAGAVAGLAETGSHEDVPLLRQHTNHPIASVRKAAVGGVGYLDPDNARGVVLDALHDNASAVRKAARAVVLAHMHLLTPGEVRALFWAAGDRPTRLVLLPIMTNFGWWDSVCLLMPALSVEDPEIRSRVINRLQRCQSDIRRLAAHPSPGQQRLLEASLAAHGHLLDRSLQEDLRSVLAYARKEQHRRS